MLETTAYLVRWERRNAAAQSRRFENWESAKAFYDELACDPKTTKASLAETAEKELRSFEREPALARGGAALRVASGAD